MPVAIHEKLLIFTDSTEKFHLRGVILDMLTNYKINADQSIKAKKLLDFLSEIRFNVTRVGNKSPRDKSLVIFNNWSAIRTGGLNSNGRPKVSKRRMDAKHPIGT